MRIRRSCLLALLLGSMAAGWGFGSHSAWPAGAVAARAPLVTITGRARLTSLKPGQRQTFTAVVRSTGYLGPVLVDFEVHNSFGATVFAAVKKVRLVAGRPVTVTQRYVPGRANLAGRYYLKTGVFGPRWKPLYVWNDNADSFVLRGVRRPGLRAAGAVTPSWIYPGQAVTLTVYLSVRGPGMSNLVTDVEVDSPSAQVFHRGQPGVRIASDGTARVSMRWAVPASMRAGVYTVKVGIFGPRWTPLYFWSDHAATLHVA